MEATLYALLAGCHNLGNTISEYLGAYALEHFNCTPRGDKNESAKFDNLYLCALFATCCPMITILLIPWMIPDARQTEPLLDEDSQSATKGSLLNHWRGRD